jgi:biotin transport system substrate-specific component
MESATDRCTGARSKAASRQGVFIALFAALICVSSFWVMPFIPGVPIVLKNLVVVLAGVLLGTWRGGAAAALFLLAGLLGLPVFVNAGGFAAFLSPTGGYLVGYVLASLISGLIAGVPSVKDKKPSFFYGARIVVALFTGFLALDLCGASWLVVLNGWSGQPQPSLGIFLGGILPFIPADSIKFALSIPLAFTLRPIVARYINPEA